jgi:Rieske Fe-S protein
MTADDITERAGPSRRTVLAVGAAGASTVALAACTKAKTSSSSAGSTPSPAGSTSSPASGASSSGASGGSALAKLSDVPVGKSVAAKGSDGKPILITRVSDSTVKAFSAICTHQGCPVPATFRCPCHGSVYDPKTGAHVSGPAPSALPEVTVKISGDSIVAG